MTGAGRRKEKSFPPATLFNSKRRLSIGRRFAELPHGQVYASGSCQRALRRDWAG